MKKLLVFLALIFLVSCSSDAHLTQTVANSYDVDMSVYQGMDAYDHHFKGIAPEEFVKLYVEDKTGIFFFSSPSCEYCQKAVAKLETACVNLGVSVYYIDTDSNDYPFSEYRSNIYDILYDKLPVDEQGKKALYIPLLFVMENGEIKNVHVGLTDKVYDESEDMQKELVAIYEDVMIDFKAE